MGAMLAFHVRIGWNWIRGDSRTNYYSNSSKLCRMYSFSCSTSSLVRTFARLLGYELDAVHLYKELGGRELVMRRQVEEDGATTWKPR